jgi:hypothetical protein
VAIVNGYCTLAELKTALAITDAVDDVSLNAAINTTSRMIDDYTNRFFYKDGTVQAPVERYYTAIDFFQLYVDDFTSISEIATDDNFNQTWSTVFAADDAMFEPVNNPRRGWPYSRLLAIGSYIFPANLPQAVRVTGVWGWPSVPSEINAACIIQASRIFNRRQSPFGIAGSPDIGTVRLLSRLDADVELLLRPFRKVTVAK